MGGWTDPKRGTFSPHIVWRLWFLWVALPRPSLYLSLLLRCPVLPFATQSSSKCSVNVPFRICLRSSFFLISRMCTLTRGMSSFLLCPLTSHRGSVKSRRGQGRTILRPFSSAVSSLSSHGLSSTCTFVLCSSLYKDAGLSGLGPIPMNSFNMTSLKPLSPNTVTF